MFLRGETVLAIRFSTPLAGALPHNPVADYSSAFTRPEQGAGRCSSLADIRTLDWLSYNRGISKEITSVLILSSISSVGGLLYSTKGATSKPKKKVVSF